MQDPLLSYDFINGDNDPEGGWHGTRCAGVVAAVRDGSTCGVGVAYDSKISGECTSLFVFLLVVAHGNHCMLYHVNLIITIKNFFSSILYRSPFAIEKFTD